MCKLLIIKLVTRVTCFILLYVCMYIYIYIINKKKKYIYNTLRCVTRVTTLIINQLRLLQLCYKIVRYVTTLIKSNMRYVTTLIINQLRTYFFELTIK